MLHAMQTAIFPLFLVYQNKTEQTNVIPKEMTTGDRNVQLNV